SLVSAGQKIGPAFTSATGYGYKGFYAGSKALATQIKGKVQKADIFISASPDVDTSLMGAKNRDWVAWDAKFGTSTRVLGSNPTRKCAHDLQTMPWWKVVAMSGFRLGMTDPKLDPKGVLSVAALNQAAKAHSSPALAKLAQTSNFPEESLSARLQS